MRIVPAPRRRAATALGLLFMPFLLFPSRADECHAFAGDPIWDDGKAEFNLYQAEEPRYGEKRSFEARMIVVKEDLKRDLRVKSDDGPVPGKTVEVLKLNHVRRVPTGTYDYHQMLSVFLERASLRPLKLAMSHFESCGITYVEILPQTDHLLHTSHSYWDREGDRMVEIPFGPEGLLYDALPLQLRGMDFEEIRPRKVSVLPTQISGRVKNLSLVTMTLQVAGRQKVAVPAGTFDAFRVELSGPQGKDRYYFEAALPHRLLRMETAEGSVYRLRKSLRLDYWNHHDNGDDRLLQ